MQKISKILQNHEILKFYVIMMEAYVTNFIENPLMH